VLTTVGDRGSGEGNRVFVTKGYIADVLSWCSQGKQSHYPTNQQNGNHEQSIPQYVNLGCTTEINTLSRPSQSSK
jgi:hypothetical protein